MSKEDIVGIAGGMVCFFLAWIDLAWRPFWAVAGAVLIAWSAATAFKGRRRR